MEPVKEPTTIDVLKSALGKAVSIFRDEIATVRSKLEAAKRRREDLLAGPLTRADVTALLFSYVDFQADRYPADLQRSIAQLHSERSFKSGETAASRAGEFVAGGLLNPSGNGPALSRTLMYLLRNEVKTGIAAAVEQIQEWPENTGPPLPERAAELAKLEAEIKALEIRMKEFKEEQQKISASFN